MNHGWQSTAPGTTLGGTNGLVLGSSRFGIYHNTQVDKLNPSVKAKIKNLPTGLNSSVNMDISYSARQVGKETYSNLMKLRVQNNKLYVVTAGGSPIYLMEMLSNTIYDVQMEYVSTKQNGTNAVNIYAGLQGQATLQKTLAGPDVAGFDLFYGRVSADYYSGTGYLLALDFLCTGAEQAVILPESAISRILKGNGGDTGPLSECIAGQPNFFDYGNQTDSGFFDDPNRIMYNHSRNQDAYPHVGAYCLSTKTHSGIKGLCNYDDLKVSIQKYPACFKESMNYCVDVLYPAQAGINEGSTEGVLSCTTILMSSSFYDQAAAPTLNWVVDLILNNWFVIIIVVMVVLIGASFAGNKRR